MNTDIRLSVDFFDHPKTIKLQRRLGHEGVHCLLRLWLFAAKHKVSGELSDMDEEEIALAAKWPNDPSTFVTTLVEIRWIDHGDTYALHDWVDHNGYASSATDRSDKSRFSRMAKTHKSLYDTLRAQGYEAISAEEYKRVTAPVRVTSNEPLNEEVTTVERPLNESLTNQVSPLPSPLPSPSLEETIIIDEPIIDLSPQDKVILAYNKFCPSFPRAMDLGTGTRWINAKRVFAKYGEKDGGGERFLDELFRKAEASDRLTNRDSGWKGYRVDLDWLLKEENYIKVLEGKYDNGVCPPPIQKSIGNKKQPFKGMSNDDKKIFLGTDE